MRTINQVYINGQFVTPHGKEVEDLSHFSFAYKKAFGSAPTLH